MKLLSYVTPISCNKINNLKLTDYILLYLDKDKKLKRAIPDFSENFIDYENSLLEEAINADRVGIFKIVLPKKVRFNTPVFGININEHGEVTGYDCGEHSLNIENFLLDSERRETASKLLKKRS